MKITVTITNDFTNSAEINLTAVINALKTLRRNSRPRGWFTPNVCPMPNQSGAATKEGYVTVLFNPTSNNVPV